ncbi:hypothetical protein ACWC4E_25260, partial [Streptomyces sp. NPDC001273]
LRARLAAGLSAGERPVVVVLDEFDRVTSPEIDVRSLIALVMARGSSPGNRFRCIPYVHFSRCRRAGHLGGPGFPWPGMKKPWLDGGSQPGP